MSYCNLGQVMSFWLEITLPLGTSRERTVMASSRVLPCTTVEETKQNGPTY